MYIETTNGVRLLHPTAGKVISNASGDFHAELVYMGVNATIGDFAETDPPATPESESEDMKSALRTLGVTVDG